VHSTEAAPAFTNTTAASAKMHERVPGRVRSQPHQWPEMVLSSDTPCLPPKYSSTTGREVRRAALPYTTGRHLELQSEPDPGLLRPWALAEAQ